jgi:DNA-binding response OmpR family regulator
MVSNSAKIIAVDDEPGLRNMIEDYLTVQGYSVRTAENGAALDMLYAQEPADLLLLDVNMPGEDGISIAARMRQAYPSTGIIMLTAAAAETNRIAGLQNGADDYVVKPFELRELLARVRSVLRRLPPKAEDAGSSSQCIGIGSCKLDLDGRRLVDAQGIEIAISLKEFELLSVFVRHPRQIMSRERLSELAHGEPLDAGDRSVDIRITRLRKKLEADPSNPSVLKTVRGEGYFFDAPR